MKKRFEEADLSRVVPVSIAERASKVTVDDVVDPSAWIGGAAAAGRTLADAMPDLLAARSLKAVARALLDARAGGREIVWMIGAHTIKCGLSRYLRSMLEEGFATCVATTGSSTVHDMELAFFGKTSEDVAVELPAGRFGMSRETAERFEAAVRHAKEQELGLGNGVGDYVISAGARHEAVSVFAGAQRSGAAATVHVALGTDITHQHASFPAADVAELSMKDFRIFTHRVGRVFDHGVVVLFGSAVVLPEVFLKAVSVNYNLGASPAGVTCAAFDMIQHYRVRENVLSRPFHGAAVSHSITGHHEIMMPLLYLLLHRPDAAR